MSIEQVIMFLTVMLYRMILVFQKVKQSIYNTSRAIAKEIGDKLKVEFDQNALDVIAELTYKRLYIYGTDLEAFQK